MEHKVNIDSEYVLKKLKVIGKENVLIVNAPKEFLDILTDFDFDTKINSEKNGRYDFIQIFASQLVELDSLLADVKTAGKFDCLFWACYPKMTGQIKSDLKRDRVGEALLKIGIRPVTQIEIDVTWSALRARPHKVT